MTDKNTINKDFIYNIPLSNDKGDINILPKIKNPPKKINNKANSGKTQSKIENPEEIEWLG